MEPVIRNVEGASNPILGPEDGVPNYVMLYVQHAPGASSAHHTHPWEHQAFIVEGSGILWVDGNEYPIKSGDAVLVPPGSEHHFTNTGDVMLSRVTVNPLSSVGGGG
ncbi:MAG: cupin domain-containing protein [Chloroflexi bacterium]|nr:cupin domain-containing protein [Chloroflexota bacterium]